MSTKYCNNITNQTRYTIRKYQLPIFMLINNTRYQILEVLFSLPIEKEKRKEKRKYINPGWKTSNVFYRRRSNRSFKQIKKPLYCFVTRDPPSHGRSDYLLILCKKKKKKKIVETAGSSRSVVRGRWNKVLPVSVELLMVLFAVEMADWLVTGVPTVVAVVVEELFGERAALAAWACAWAWAWAWACCWRL